MAKQHKSKNTDRRSDRLATKAASNKKTPAAGRNDGSNPTRGEAPAPKAKTAAPKTKPPTLAPFPTTTGFTYDEEVAALLAGMAEGGHALAALAGALLEGDETRSAALGTLLVMHAASKTDPAPAITDFLTNTVFPEAGGKGNGKNKRLNDAIRAGWPR